MFHHVCYIVIDTISYQKIGIQEILFQNFDLAYECLECIQNNVLWLIYKDYFFLITKVVEGKKPMGRGNYKSQ